MYPERGEGETDDEDSKGNCCPHHPRLRGYLGQILDESNLHGVRYLGFTDRHIVERIFWVIAVSACFGFSIYLAAGVYSKYNASPVIISFQPEETSISRISFPAITLCNVNIIKNSTLQGVFERLKKHLKESNVTWTTAVRDATESGEHLTHFCMDARSFRNRLNESVVNERGEVTRIVEVINEYIMELNKTFGVQLEDEEDIEDADRRAQEAENLFTEGAHNCEDMILKCMWSGEEVACNKVFRPIVTRHGSCCVFNMMPRYMLRKLAENDSRIEPEKNSLSQREMQEWGDFQKSDLIRDDGHSADIQNPRYQSAGGKLHGLSILVNPELHKYSTCTTNDAFGLKMVAHSPISFPTIMEYGSALPPHSEVFVDLEPQVTTVDVDALKNIDVEKRGCLLPSDKEAQLESYNFYTSTNCIDDCITRLTNESCGCARFFMATTYTDKLCGARKRECAEKVRYSVRNAGKTELCPNCLPSCIEAQYQLHMSSLPLRNATIVYNTSTEMNLTASNYSIIHIFYGDGSLYVKERKTLYGWFELIANAGGLLGLTLGFSIISIVEVLYFLSLRAWFKFREYRLSDNQRESERMRNDNGNRQGVIETEKERIMRTGMLSEIVGSRHLPDNVRNGDKQKPVVFYFSK